MIPAVQKLSSVQRPVVLRHLLTLSEDDRRLRFGTYMSDAALANYVQRIDFARDKVFGIFAHDLALIGVAHVALDPAGRCAELGLSVELSRRGNGYGLALLNRGKLCAITRGYSTLFMHCLVENKIMIHLARKAGLRIVSEQGEVDAHLELESTSPAAVAREALEDQIALADLLLKQQFNWCFPVNRAA